MARRHSASEVPGGTVTGCRRLSTRSRSSASDGHATSDGGFGQVGHAPKCSDRCRNGPTDFMMRRTPDGVSREWEGRRMRHDARRVIVPGRHACSSPPVPVATRTRHPLRHRHAGRADRADRGAHAEPVGGRCRRRVHPDHRLAELQRDGRRSAGPLTVGGAAGDLTRQRDVRRFRVRDTTMPVRRRRASPRARSRSRSGRRTGVARRPDRGWPARMPTRRRRRSPARSRRSPRSRTSGSSPRTADRCTTSSPRAAGRSHRRPSASTSRGPRTRRSSWTSSRPTTARRPASASTVRGPRRPTRGPCPPTIDARVRARRRRRAPDRRPARGRLGR